MKKINKYKKSYNIGKNIFGKKTKVFKKLKNLKWKSVNKRINPFWKDVKESGYRVRLNRQYFNDLKMKKQIKIFYGYIQENQLLNMYKKTKKSQSTDMIDLLETRLSTIIYRAGFCFSMRQAYQLINHGFFLVNSKKVTSPGYKVRPFDIIEVDKKLWKSLFAIILVKFSRKKLYKLRLYKLDLSKNALEFLVPSIISIPKEEHLEINFKTLSIILLKKPKINKIYFPQTINFKSLKRFYN